MSEPVMTRCQSVTNDRLEWLECIRACAALLVVAYHASNRIDNLYSKGAIAWERRFEFGNAGVDLFFVISGFIVAHIHFSDIGQPRQYLPYVYKRVTRIYPLYWILFLLVMPLYFLVPTAGEDFQRNALNLIASFFLLPVPPKQVIGLAWSLVPDLIFYAFFGLAILHRRLGISVLVVWAVLIMCNHVFALSSSYIIGQLLSVCFIVFFAGIAVALLMKAGVAPWSSRAALAAGVTTFVLAPHVLPPLHGAKSLSSHICLYLVAALLVWLAIGLDRREVSAPRLLVALGNATYSICLFHWLMGWVAEQVIAKVHLQPYISPLPYFIALCIGMTVAGYLVHNILEKPMMRFSRIGLQWFAPSRTEFKLAR